MKTVLRGDANIVRWL